MRQIASVVVILLVAVPAFAFDGWSFYWENDAFVTRGGTDEHYTNGLRLTLNKNENAWFESFATKFCRGFCEEGDPDCTRSFCKDIDPRTSVALVIGQNFYTPNDIENPNPQPNDRPWAGFLYIGGMGVITDANERRQDTFEVQLGILGPGAGAAKVQTRVHELGFSSRIPVGWPNQLDNEPAVNFLYDQSRRYGTSTFDFVPQAGFILGTIQTYAHLGGIVRLGRNITGFPVALILPTATPSAPKPKWELYVFAGIDGRAVLHNAFLDGGFIEDGPSVDKNTFVSDMRVGLSARYRRLRVNYSLVQRSSEFDAPPGQPRAHRFGSVMIGFEPR